MGDKSRWDTLRKWCFPYLTSYSIWLTSSYPRPFQLCCEGVVVCAALDREKSTLLGGKRGNVSKMFKNQILLRSFSTLLLLIVGSLHCVLGQDTLLSQCLSSPKCINGYQRINAGGHWPCNGLASHPGEIRNTPSHFMLQKPEISTPSTFVYLIKFTKWKPEFCP